MTSARLPALCIHEWTLYGDCTMRCRKCQAIPDVLHATDGWINAVKKAKAAAAYERAAYGTDPNATGVYIPAATKIGAVPVVSVAGQGWSAADTPSQTILFCVGAGVMLGSAGAAIGLLLSAIFG